MSGSLYRGTFKRRAKQVRDAAYADPRTQCWRCGGLARPDDPWQAGHVRDGDPYSPLAAEHRSCNARAGRLSQLASQRGDDGLAKERVRWGISKEES